MEIKNNVRELRKKKGWSQEKLANEARLTRKTIFKIEKQENYNVSISTMNNISKALKKPASEIFFNYHV